MSKTKNPNTRHYGWLSASFVLLGLIVTGCSVSSPSHGQREPHVEEMSFDQLAQTDFNRTVTIAMRDNLETLGRLLEKLYRRNPSEWRKTGEPTLEAAVERGRNAISRGIVPSDLVGLRDIEILSVSLDPGYRGDRVGAFIFGLADTVIQAHNGKIRFYVSDMLEAQKVFNAARNVEIAAWLLNTRRDEQGQPLLLANEINDHISNLSFEREFGQMVGRLDLIANLLDENLRRVGINYVQGLLFFSFLPVR